MYHAFKAGLRGLKRGFPAVSVHLFLALFFALGTLFGCLWAFVLRASMGETLSRLLDSVLPAAAAGPVSAFSVLCELLRWPLLLFLFSLAPCARPAVPALFFLRGFFLSFAVSALTAAYGAAGLFAAGILFGLSAVCSVPALFLLGECLYPRTAPLRIPPGTAILTAGLILFSFFLEHTAIPALLDPLLKLLIR